jgi:hypothetical protein
MLHGTVKGKEASSEIVTENGHKAIQRKQKTSYQNRIW